MSARVTVDFRNPRTGIIPMTTDGRIHRQRQADGQAGRHPYRLTYTHAYIHTDRQTHTRRHVRAHAHTQTERQTD